jgi:hypothetical protein
MRYVIGYGMRGKAQVSWAEKSTGREALTLVVALERSDEQIKFIRRGHRAM